MAKYTPKGMAQKDFEIDRREFNGHTLVLLEDRTKNLMKSDGTSGQYVLAIEMQSKKSPLKFLAHYRFITDLMRKKGFENAKEAARAMFLHPEDYKPILGEHWIAYQEALSNP